MKFRLLVSMVLVALAAVMGPASVALAGGFEYPANGTRALGRGGAFYARADDPTAVLHNPAALARMSGVQLQLGGNATFFKGCIDRINPDNPTENQDDPSEANYPKVCNGARFSPIPNLALSWRVNKHVGLGFGVFAPSAFLGMKWGSTSGDNYGTIDDPNSTNPDDRIPAPTRYLLHEDEVIVLFSDLRHWCDTPQVALVRCVVRTGLHDRDVFSDGTSRNGRRRCSR